MRSPGSTPGCATTSGRRSRRWSSAAAGARVQRTGWGKSAVYFVATALLRERAGPDGDRLAAAGADAQPDRRRRAGRDPRAPRSTRPTPTSGTRSTARSPAGEVDVLLVSPERLNNPDFRDQVLPELAATRRAARGRRGALHLRLGPRLPARLPPAPHAARRAAAPACRCWPPRPPPTPASPRDVAEQLRPGRDGRRPGAARPLDRESLRLGVLRLPTPDARLAWLADHLRRAARVRASSTRSRSPRPRRSPRYLRAQGYDGGGVLRADRAGRAAGRRGRTCSTTGSRRWSPRRRWAWASTSPTSASSSTSARRRRPIAYYQQVGRAGRGVERAEVILLPGVGGRGDLGLLRLAGVPARAAGPRRARRAGATRTGRCPPPALETAGRPAPHPAGDDAQGARRRRRGAPGAGRLDGDRAAVGVRRGALRPGRRRRARPSSRRCSDYATPPAAGWSSCAGSSTTPRRAPCGRCDNCAGRTARREVGRRRAGRAARRLRRPGVEIEPRKHVADRADAVGVAAQGPDPAGERREPGRALGRLTDLGWGNRLRELLGPGAGRPGARRRLRGAVVQVLAAWDGRSGRSPWSRSASGSGPGWSAAWPAAGPGGPAA